MSTRKYRLVPVANLKHLYAANGAIKQIVSSDDGEISEKDKLWLEENGGPLPPKLIPLQDKTFIQQHAHKNLYAQDGSIKLSEKIHPDGTLSQIDIDWLDNHGGPAPLDMIPSDDRVSIIRTHLSSHIEDNRDIYHASDHDLDYEIINNDNDDNKNNNNNNNLIKNLYAANGNIKQIIVNEENEISLEDLLWLEQNDGPLPCHLIPLKDRLFVQQRPHKYLYAKDGSIKLSLKINIDGTLQSDDLLWLDQHGGQQSIEMIPPHDRVQIRKSVEHLMNDNNNDINDNNEYISNYEINLKDNLINKKPIKLYAMNGEIKETILDKNGKICHEDAEWLKQNGGSKHLRDIPKEDRAYVYDPVEPKIVS